MPEPHILLKVTAPALMGRPGGRDRNVWRLTLAGHQAIAKQDFVHGSGRDTGALNRRLDGSSSQVMRGQRREITLKTPHGGAGRPDDHDAVSHISLSIKSASGP